MNKKTRDCLKFLQQLVRVQSLPGQEGNAAAVVESEMKRLKFDLVERDEAGNVLGLCRGLGQAPSMMFNAHLDHVDVGDPKAWPHPPHQAEIFNHRVWGRGTVDIKGPLAAQIHAVAGIMADGHRPPGDVFLTAVVQEETGGLGTRHLVKHLKTPFVVVGEPSQCEVRRGHRGRSELRLHVTGRSVHASIPEKAVNPLEVAARFILGLKDLQMSHDRELGFSSVAPTLLRTDQTSPNVTPGELWLTCDCRTLPAEDMQKKLTRLAELCLLEGAAASVEAVQTEQVSYTGMKMSIAAEHPPFLLPAAHPAVETAVSVLRDAIGLRRDSGVWRFATDGGLFVQAGQTVIGFGPGQEELAHTVRESIEIVEIERALAGNRALALEWPKRNR